MSSRRSTHSRSRSSSPSSSYSSSASSSRKLKKSDPVALRKYVLKKNHKDRISRSHLELVKRELTTNAVARSRSASPSGRLVGVFQLHGTHKIRVKRSVSIELDKIIFHTVLYIYHDSLNQKQYEKVMDSQVPVATGKSYRVEEQIPVETVSQTTYYGKRMIRLVRDVVLPRESLTHCWETTDERGVRDGWETAVDGGQPGYSAVKADSISRNSQTGYSNATRIVFLFNQEAEPKTTELKRCPNEYRARVEMPNLEDCIHFGEKVKARGATLEFVQEVQLSPMIQQLNGIGHVEELREYLFNPREDRVQFLDRSTTASFDRSSMFMPSPEERSLWATPNQDEYRTPQERPPTAIWNTLMETSRNVEITPPLGGEMSTVCMTPLEEMKPGVHAIAIPAPRRPVPRLVLNPTPATESPALNTAISPGQQGAVSQEIRLDDTKPRMTMDVSRKASSTRMTHKHAMTMSVDIGGEACEFTGNISYEGPANMQFTPKRVLVDGKLLWQQSNDWNPTSVTNSQINMPLDETGHSHK